MSSLLLSSQSFFHSISLSIVQLVHNASDYACTGRYQVQASAMFLNELSISLSLPLPMPHLISSLILVCTIMHSDSVTVVPSSSARWNSNHLDFQGWITQQAV